MNLKKAESTNVYVEGIYRIDSIDWCWHGDQRILWD